MRLEVDKLGVTSRGTVLLNDISFSLNNGERLAVVGITGAGKSMLTLAVAGLLPPGMRTAGAVRLDGAPINRKLLGSRIGLLRPDAGTALDPLRTIGAQIVADPDLLKDAGVDLSVLSRYPQQLTRAERHCIAVALVLARKPELLVADDPTAGLDLSAQRQVVEMIRRHCTERGMALLLVTHDLKLAAALATHVLVLTAGKVVEAGNIEDVLAHPQHDHTRRIINAGRYRTKTLMGLPIGGMLLDIRNVGRRYRAAGSPMLRRGPSTVALEDVSFSIRAGESLMLVGAAGSGKSTLARIIAGLERATSGELEFENAVYHGSDLPPPLRREISFVGRDPARAFNPRLTMGESITEPLRLDALKSMDELSARIVEVVNAVGLSAEMLALTPQSFSMTQLQRFAIARALITRPQLIVLDEPGARLDVVARGSLLVLLARLRADFALTYLLIGHDLEVARIIADRVIVLDHGKLVESGAPAAVFSEPQHAATQRLLAAALPEVVVAPVQ